MVNRYTGFSANMMMLGKEVFTPVDIIFGTQSETYKAENLASYIDHIRSILREVHELAVSKLRTHLQYQKRTYDLKLNQAHYEVGDYVY